MSKFINITDVGEREILTSANYKTHSSTNVRGSNRVTVSKVIICNESDNEATVSLYVYQIASPNNSYKLFRLVKIPPFVTFVWDHPITFNISTHSLRLYNAGTSPGLTLTID